MACAIQCVSKLQRREVGMNKTKQRAVSILLLLGGILAVLATWNLADDLPPEVN
jgi:hypothetical protein